jgi:hypothetical protein
MKTISRQLVFNVVLQPIWKTSDLKSSNQCEFLTEAFQSFTDIFLGINIVPRVPGGPFSCAEYGFTSEQRTDIETPEKPSRTRYELLGLPSAKLQGRLDLWIPPRVFSWDHTSKVVLYSAMMSFRPIVVVTLSPTIIRIVL